MERRYRRGGQGTSLTHPTRRPERGRDVTVDKDGAANVSVKKPDPPDKVVIKANFSYSQHDRKPSPDPENGELLAGCTHLPVQLHRVKRRRSRRYSDPAHHRSHQE